MIGAAVTPGPKSFGPRLNDLKVTGTEYGATIPWVVGSPRLAGQIIWASERRETAKEEEQGKGGGPTYTSYTYDVDLLILISENQIPGIGRIWSNGELVYANGAAQSGAWTDMRVYTGAADQLPDPTYEAAVGLGNAPAYRGMGTVLIQGLQLGNGGSIPNLTFEIGVGADPRESVLVSVVATRVDTDVNLRWDSNETTQPTWASYFSEFHDTGMMRFLRYTATPGRGDTGVIAGPYTVPIDVDAGYRLSASNNYYVDDVCAFNFEFLDGAGNIVAIISSPGYLAGYQWTHRVYYGSSYGTLVKAEPIDDTVVARTSGVISFEPGLLRFTRDPLGDANPSFTFACDARSIRSVRARNMQASSGNQYPMDPGNPSGNRSNPNAYIRLQCIPRTAQDMPLPTLGSAVQYLMRRCGYADADYALAAELTGLGVHALAVGQVSSTRSVLEVLQQAFFLEVSADEQIRIRRRTVAPAAAIPFADLGMAAGSGGDDEPLAITLGNDLEMPAQLALSYPNMSGDYQTATEFSDRLLSGQQSTEAIQTALGLTPAEAKAIVDGLLMDRVASLATATLKTPLKYARLESGDVVNAVNSDGRTYRLRIQSKTDAMPTLELKCVLDDVGAIDSAAVTDTGYVNTETVIQPASTVFEALDIPILRDADDAAGYYLAVAPQRAAETDKWPGAVVAQSWDGTNYVQLLTTTAQNVMGTATTVLGNWQGGVVFDEANTVTVQVSGELASSTRDAMLLDDSINALLLGSEIVRFRSAALLSPGVYLLSGLLRGQRGTEWAMGTHAAGERCVLLGNALRRVASQTNEIGLERQIKAVTLGMFLSDGTPKGFTDTGVALKPFSPANPRALADGADLLVTWQRRTRRSYQYAGAAPVVPLGEASEAYRVRVSAGATQLRSDVVTAATYRYTSDMQAADGVASGTALQFEICQISATVGPGYPSTVGAKAP
ncbi:hypothetical protein GCM10010975_26470 [Comamonas phosphati]|nr:hypothetical protein GCM10010975_26470 [Comamonas phosphati]